MNDFTDFGYQRVLTAEKTEKVSAVFNHVAEQYDVMNDLMSFGLHRVWKQFVIQLSGVKKGQSVLDVAGGSGDLTRHFAKAVGSEGQVYLADINAAMLDVGRSRLIDAGIFSNVHFIQANAECLPFPDNFFHCITIAFGLRNVTHKERALESMYRVLKPGGSMLILEFSKPVLALLKKCYDRYSFDVIPRLGEWIVGDAESYQYLVESIRMHPDQETLKQMMVKAGFESCDYYNLTGGIVALHRGYKF